MNPEITKRIEHYLQNELSAQDRAAFVQEMNTNADLLREVALQQSIHESAKRLAQRTLVQRTAKRYHLQKTLVATTVVVVIATAIAAAVWLSTRSSTQPQQQEMLDTTEMTQLIEKIEKELPLDGAPAEYFNLSPKDTVVLSESGVLLSVPDDAFMTGGKIYEGPKVIQWQEAFDAATIVKCGLSTTAGDRLLETQGMFAMQVFTPEGKQLDINPKVGVYIQIPVAERKEGMMLFEGKKGKNGVIDWQNPQPLEKLPVMADMSELDFYPPGYEAHLDAAKWKTAKKDRDSLYLSFENEKRTVPRDEFRENKQHPGLTATYESFAPEVQQGVALPRVNTSINNVSARGTADPLLGITDVATSTYSSAWTDKITWTCSVEKTDASHGVIVAKAVLKPGWHVFSADHDPANAEGTGMPTEMIAGQDGKIRFDGPLRDGGKPEEHVDDMGKSLYFSGTAVFRQPFTVSSGQPLRTSVQLSFQICDESGCLFPPAQVFSLDMSGFAGEANGHIPPSKVLAFWQKDFNNTLLSTRDFERRMAAIHGTCSEEVLDLYTDNLNKPLHVIDAMAAKLGHDEFKAFAEERVGAVKLDNPHMNNMRRFYANAVAKLQKEAKQDRNFIRKQEAMWERELRTIRKKEAKSATRRNRTAVAEEQRFNRAALARQLSDNTIGVTIRINRPAWNYDAYRPFIATRYEQKSDGSMEYVREVTRRLSADEVEVTTKKSTLKYNSFSASVDDPGRYGKLMLYLFPHNLNSYLRIDGVNGRFARALNDQMTYDIAVVGIAEDGYFLYEKRGINEGDLGTVNMQHVSEETFAYRIEALNRNRGEKPLDVKLDLEWLARERANYKVQRLREENRAFREALRSKVFPCFGTEVPESDSIAAPAGEPRADNPGLATVEQGVYTASVVSGFAESPRFPGGTKALRQYLSDNTQFPEAAWNRSVDGTCKVTFNVERDGKLTNLHVTQKVTNCPECDEEALRVIRSMPPWKPAEWNGSPKADVYTIPIRFKLDGTVVYDPDPVKQ